MRSLVLVSLFLMACGSSSGDGVSGTVGGRAFSPVEVKAVLTDTGSTPCSLPNPVGGGSITFGVAATAISFTSYANACGDYASGQCTLHADAQNVTVLLAKLDPLAPTVAPALTPGTFTVTASPAAVTPDGSGRLNVAFAQALATAAAPACAGTPSPSVAGGTLRVDEVSATRVVGNVNLTFADGSKLAGDFAADVCAGAEPDICSLATSQSLCTLPPVCLP
jgi:hypothetical protein